MPVLRGGGISRYRNRISYCGLFLPGCFFCHPVFKLVYLASITSLGAATVRSFFFYSPIGPAAVENQRQTAQPVNNWPGRLRLQVVMCASLRFRTPEFRWMRTGLFIALGAAGIIPVGHGVYLYGLSLAVEAVSLKHLLAMGTVYIVGALIYASRIPESLAPGRFDIWFHSHQIFHCCVGEQSFPAIFVLNSARRTRRRVHTLRRNPEHFQILA
ncbi:MAG: hemolysin-III related-domain-containing protein, partial [Olpidium bornovanus]